MRAAPVQRLSAVLAALLIAATACSSSKPAGSAGTTTPLPSARPSSTATVKITSPPNGGSVNGPKVHVQVVLTGGRIVPVVSKNIKPDEGHIHVKLDGATLTFNAGLEYDIPEVKPGNHQLEVEFVASDHAPFDPRVFSGITFTVK
jgi:hypothetical protein